MTEKTAEIGFGRWTNPQVALSIEYRLDVMDQIRAALSNAAVDAGGVLFGTHQDDAVKIIDWRPMSLSANDRRDLVRLLLAAKQDPGLQDLQPVGWFLSHKHGDISLSPSDLETFDGFFGEPWQVTLVLVPASADSARAVFFVREADGTLRSGDIQHPVAKVPRAQHLRWLWAIPTLLAIVLAGVLIKPQRPEPVTQGFLLRIQGDGPVLQINWDPKSLPVRGASRAEIDIQDGGQPAHLQVTGVQLSSGKMSWQRHTGEVQVQMTLYTSSGAVVRETTRLRIATVSVPPPPPAPNGEVKKLNEELRREKVRSDRLQKMVKILENRLEIDTARNK